MKYAMRRERRRDARAAEWQRKRRRRGLTEWLVARGIALTADAAGRVFRAQARNKGGQGRRK